MIGCSCQINQSEFILDIRRRYCLRENHVLLKSSKTLPCCYWLVIASWFQLFIMSTYIQPEPGAMAIAGVLSNLHEAVTNCSYDVIQEILRVCPESVHHRGENPSINTGLKPQSRIREWCQCHINISSSFLPSDHDCHIQ